MAGRGGYKPTTSLRPEQLQGMGITGKDMQSSIVTPPPTFPPLLSKPAMLEKNAERDFIIDWKEHFLAYLKDSCYHTNASSQQKRTEQRFNFENSNNDNIFAWSFMPAELRPNWKRKLQVKDGLRKQAKIVNVEETLKALEQKEIKRRKTDNDVRKIKGEGKESENENENVEDEEQDDEMDEDNDYGFSYFDNGDDYNDEDDNLDDGPIY